jgi:hypothetical protein
MEKHDHLLKRYRALYEAEFRLIENCVIAFIPGYPEPRNLVLSNGSSDRARHENQENHEHFDYPIGDSVYIRWQNNLVLALNLRDFWQLKLANRFPGREFVFPIWNEIGAYMDESGNVQGVEIVPVLRMWSKLNDPQGEFHRAFCVEQSDPKMITLRENALPVFVPGSHVFTKDFQVRKHFLRSLKEAGREYLC